MSLNALVVCSDEKIVRVLRRVLSELEIRMTHCAESDLAVRRLTRERFEAVIVDCANEQTAGLVLRSARTAPCNKHSVAVAIVNGRSAFDLGAHFVLYQPITMERAKASFRAVRALMKRERRRNARVPVQIPISISLGSDQGPIRCVSVDLGEGGMAVQMLHRPKRTTGMLLEFTLPGTDYKVMCKAEIAWENAAKQSGVRFAEISSEAHEQIKTWIKLHTPELEADDPPAPCTLTDLTLSACYVKMSSPLPTNTAVVLSMRTGSSQMNAAGIVRVMHPEVGMGIEFSRGGAEQKDNLEKFIEMLAHSGASAPTLTVEPEGLVADEAKMPTQASDDPLLILFKDSNVSPENFHAELHKQRNSQAEAAAI